MGLRENLQQKMDAKGMNPHSLAGETGVPQPTIHRILDGTSRDPRRATLEPLAKYFGVTVDELCGTKGSHSQVLTAEQEQILEIMGSVGKEVRDAWLTIGRALASAQLITDKHVKSALADQNALLQSASNETEEEKWRDVPGLSMSMPSVLKVGNVSAETSRKPRKGQQEKK